MGLGVLILSLSSFQKCWDCVVACFRVNHDLFNTLNVGVYRGTSLVKPYFLLIDLLFVDVI